MRTYSGPKQWRYAPDSKWNFESSVRDFTGVDISIDAISFSWSFSEDCTRFCVPAIAQDTSVHVRVEVGVGVPHIHIFLTGVSCIRTARSRGRSSRNRTTVWFFQAPVPDSQTLATRPRPSLAPAFFHKQARAASRGRPPLIFPRGGRDGPLSSLFLTTTLSNPT